MIRHTYARNSIAMATNKTNAIGKVRFVNGAFAREFGKLIVDVDGIVGYQFNKETGEQSVVERRSLIMSQASVQHQLKDICPGYAAKIDEYRGIKDDAIRTRKYSNLFYLLTHDVEFEIVAEPYKAGTIFIDDVTGEEVIARYDGYKYKIISGIFPEDVLAKIAPKSREDMLNDI